jgi:hypothetical protein
MTAGEQAMMRPQAYLRQSHKLIFPARMSIPDERLS